MHMVESESHTTTHTYVKRAFRKAHFKMNRAFKIIQGHPYWHRYESRMVCCRNVQLMPTLSISVTLDDTERPKRPARRNKQKFRSPPQKFQRR